MDGSYLLTINPATLDDEGLWSYQDLQKLCKAADVRAGGKRGELVERLLEWHKTRTDAGHSLVRHEDAEDFPLNVDGSNFSILSMHVRPRSPGVAVPPPCRSPLRSGSTPFAAASSSSSGGSGTPSGGVGGSGGSSRKGAKSLVGLSDSPLVVSPTLLRPLAPTTPVRTPGKSALKGSSVKKTSAVKSRIKFSPYNGTKVIPNRRDETKGVSAFEAASEREYSRHGDSDEESLDDENEYVDEQARINAEKNVFLCGQEDGGWSSEF